MQINVIAAVAQNNAIGYQNKLIYWLPNDLKRFKALTTGHTIIMGRNTFLSLPKGALPNRRNVVLSTTQSVFPGCDCFSSLHDALQSCDANFDILLSEYPSGMYVNSLIAAKYFDIRQKYTVVGNGAAELIKSLMERVEGRIGVVYPTFQEYPNRKEQTEIIGFTPDNADLTYTADDLIRFYADKKLSTLLLINPDNPSGNFIPIADVLRLATWCKERGIFFVVDESFVDFSEDFRNNSLLHNEILQAYPNLAVMKSISKSYGVPGLRLGVLASSDEALINWMKHDVSIWNINSFAEFYMQIFGKYQKDYDRACQKFIAERERFMALLTDIPFLRVIPSQANYFLCQITEKYTSEELTRRLLMDFNILIKDCDNKDGLKNKNYVRIAVRDQKDNDTLVDALKTL